MDVDASSSRTRHKVEVETQTAEATKPALETPQVRGFDATWFVDGDAGCQFTYSYYAWGLLVERGVDLPNI